jgi:hypothetical protein
VVAGQTLSITLFADRALVPSVISGHHSKVPRFPLVEVEDVDAKLVRRRAVALGLCGLLADGLVPAPQAATQFMWSIRWISASRSPDDGTRFGGVERPPTADDLEQFAGRPVDRDVGTGAIAGEDERSLGTAGATLGRRRR